MGWDDSTASTVRTTKWGKLLQMAIETSIWSRRHRAIHSERLAT